MLCSTKADDNIQAVRRRAVVRGILNLMVSQAVPSDPDIAVRLSEMNEFYLNG